LEEKHGFNKEVNEIFGCEITLQSQDGWQRSV